LSDRLQDLETKSGWRVRVLTRFTGDEHPTGAELREAWKPDDNTVIVVVDPSSPNILSFNNGSNVQRILRQPFFTELQSRFGNMFYIREHGEQAAAIGAVGALAECLHSNGCYVVPGLDQDHYVFTLVTAVVGGIVLGASTRIDPKGFAQRRWVPPLLFSPLWGSLLISYSIAPVTARTDDLLPVLGNCGAFALAALGLYLLPRLADKGSIGEALLDASERRADQQEE